jgi:hypothetical protein
MSDNVGLGSNPVSFNQDIFIGVRRGDESPDYEWVHPLARALQSTAALRGGDQFVCEFLHEVHRQGRIGIEARFILFLWCAVFPWSSHTLVRPQHRRGHPDSGADLMRLDSRILEAQFSRGLSPCPDSDSENCEQPDLSNFIDPPLPVGLQFLGRAAVRGGCTAVNQHSVFRTARR